MKFLRPVLALMIFVLLFSTCIASAQQDGRVYKIGWLWIGAPNDVPIPMEKWSGPWMPFRETLREKGYVIGKNLIVEMRSAYGDIGRLPAMAEELVAAKVDVIVAPGTPATLAAMQATKTIPIVFPGVGDPVGKGIVASIAKPGGNVTGMAVNIETPKLWQLLRDLDPSIRLVGTLSNARNAEGLGPDASKAYLDKRAAELKAISSQVNIDYVAIRVRSSSEIEPNLAELAKRGGTALIVYTDGTLETWRTSIMEAAVRNRLITACVQAFGWAKEGCVLTYGEEPSALRQGAARQVDKILRGTKLSDIPVELPTKFRLILNMKSAVALGVTVPQSILALADEVIE